MVTATLLGSVRCIHLTVPSNQNHSVTEIRDVINFEVQEDNTARWVGLLQGFWGCLLQKKSVYRYLWRSAALGAHKCRKVCVFCGKEYNHKIVQAETRGDICAVRRWRWWWWRARVLMKTVWTQYFCQNKPRADNAPDVLAAVQL